MGRAMRRTAILLTLIVSVLFGMLWGERYRMDFNAEGRYFDEATLVVYEESSMLAFGTLCLICLALALVLSAYVRSNASRSRLGN
jgi:hypothetical protein